MTMRKDPLGRAMLPSDEPPRRRMLTDNEITAIAQEVRTRPLGEVGRHVMPLIQHIVALDDRECRTCQFWLPYNRGRDDTYQGECTHQKPREHVHVVDDQGHKVEAHAAMVTPFDWSCKAWTEAAKDNCDGAQKQL